MRVLVVTNMYPPHYFGGYELVCHDTVRRFRQKGHEVEVLTSTMRLAGRTYSAHEPGVRRGLELYWRDHELLRPSLSDAVDRERLNRRALLDAIAQFRPDVVSVWAMGAMSMGLLALIGDRGLPLVCCLADEWLLYGPDLDGWTRRFVGRPRRARAATALTGLPTALADLSSATLCFVSDRIRRRALDLSPFRLGLTTVVYLGVDVAEVPPAASGGWRWRLLYVGRIDRRKGIETALRAMPLLPGGATLEIFGRGDPVERQRLERLVDDLDVADRVRFADGDRAEVAGRYHEADAVVFPSEWEEPFGLVPLEAMASGVPVVGTGAGGSREFLLDGVNCLRFAPGDPHDLARALTRLADDAELRRLLAAAGLRTAAWFTADRMADELESWHLAAACRFTSGTPPLRTAPVDVGALLNGLTGW